MVEKRKLTDTEIHKVFQQMNLGGNTAPPSTQPQAPPPSQPLYFPLSADSLSGKNAQ